jgi:hypothetical protein
MMERRHPARVREPIQVYLDRTDRDLLEELAARTGLARAELLRRGLRRLAQTELAERKPGWSLDVLIGAMGDDPHLPTDLSTRHEEYLYGGGYERLARSRGHKRPPRPR